VHDTHEGLRPSDAESKPASKATVEIGAFERRRSTAALPCRLIED